MACSAKRANSRVAGLRTFPAVTLRGALCAALAQSFGGWVLAAGLVGLTALIVAANLMEIRAAIKSPKQPSPIE